MKYLKVYEEFNFDAWKRLKVLGLSDAADIKVLNIVVKCANGRLAKSEELELKRQAKARGLVRVSSSSSGEFIDDQPIVYAKQRWVGPKESIDWLCGFWQSINKAKPGCIDWTLEEPAPESYAKFIQEFWEKSIELGLVYRD